MDSDNKHIPIRKKWGQNFLIDKNIIKKIIKLIDPNKDDEIIEIGPGKGALTTFLSKKAGKVCGIEIDPLLFDYLEKKNLKNIKLINNDILKWEPNHENYNKVIGNIPYNISSQIIFKFINYHFWDTMVLMTQKELAERITSKHGNKTYGRVSVMVQTFCKVNLEFNISKNVFIPKPKVDSAILSFKKKNVNIEFFKFSNLIRHSFKQRRKKLKNNLKKICKVEQLGSFSNMRAEEISVKDFIKLYEKIYI